MADTYRYNFVDKGGGCCRRAIRTGSKWEKSLTIKDDQGDPIPIQNWYFEMMVRPKPESSDLIVTLSGGATPGNGRITFATDGSDGKILLTINAADTATFLNDVGFNTYDLKYDPAGGTALRDLIEGQLEIRASNTRS